MKINVGEFVISDKAKEYVNDALDNNWLSRGKYHEKFEKLFAEHHGGGKAFLVSSGTDALRISLEALTEKYGWEARNEVIVPATTFVASVNAIIQAGLKPVYCDIKKDFTIDHKSVFDLINKHTVAVMPVHLFGKPCSERVYEIAKKHGLKTVEDSCEAMFSNINGKPVGSFGDVACFSMFVSHIISGGVGGIILTQDEDLFERCKRIAVHGQPKQGVYEFVSNGYSSRITEMEAGIALAQLENCVKELDKGCWSREDNAVYLLQHLKEVSNDWLRFQEQETGIFNCRMMFPIVVNENAPFHVDELINALNQEGIATRRLFPLISDSHLNIETSQLPNSCYAQSNGCYIGCHEHLSSYDLERVVRVVARFINKLGKYVMKK